MGCELRDQPERRGVPVKYIALFIIAQLAQLPLMLLGLLLIAVMAKLGRYKQTAPGVYHWVDGWMWVYDNEQDGIDPGEATAHWKNIFNWSALRNSVHNYALLNWVNGNNADGTSKGRPLWYHEWQSSESLHYFKAGWMTSGYMCLNGGAGRGY